MRSPATPYLQVTWPCQILDQKSAQNGLNNTDAHLQTALNNNLTYKRRTGVGKIRDQSKLAVNVRTDKLTGLDDRVTHARMPYQLIWHTLVTDIYNSTALVSPGHPSLTRTYLMSDEITMSRVYGKLNTHATSPNSACVSIWGQPQRSQSPNHDRPAELCHCGTISVKQSPCCFTEARDDIPHFQATTESLPVPHLMCWRLWRAEGTFTTARRCCGVFVILAPDTNCILPHLLRSRADHDP